VERVVIYGYSKAPSKVLLEVKEMKIYFLTFKKVDGKQTELEATFENGRLTIKKPFSRITSEWVISVL
jgi:hypothetical protein